jgi:hypothetical protein
MPNGDKWGNWPISTFKLVTSPGLIYLVDNPVESSPDKFPGVKLS